jgi:hypothetical protein
MLSAAYKKRLATAIAGAALASALAVSGASAHYGASAAGDPPRVAPPPSSIAASAAEQYQGLRSPDNRDQTDGHSPTVESQPVVDEPSTTGGFDWVSAAIGAAAGTGLLLILVVAVAGSGRLRRPRAVNLGTQGPAR